MSIDEQKLNDFVGQFVGDLGAVMHAVTVVLGDRLGLYTAMGDSVPVTAAELATRTGYDQRYVAEWLAAQTASGYVEYDPTGETFRLPPEQAFTLASEDNAVFVPGGMQIARSMYADIEVIAEAFRTGEGVAWGAHHPELFGGVCRFFRANYIGNLVGSWIPALDGVEAKLTAGATVADVGCGYGASTILLAQAYPHSTFVGFDNHEPSIKAAAKAAAEAGLQNCRFETATAQGYPGMEYDLVVYSDCLHDMGDPVGAATHVRDTLAPDGTWMIIEPFAGDRLEDNINPIGRTFYSASTMLCTPASKSQEVGLALGAQAGEARLRDVVTRGGFTEFRRATESPFNLILEARP